MPDIGVTHKLNLKGGADTGVQNVSPVVVCRNLGKLDSPPPKCILPKHMIGKLNPTDIWETQNPRFSQKQFFSQNVCFGLHIKHAHWYKTEGRMSQHHGIPALDLRECLTQVTHFTSVDKSHALIIGRTKSRTELTCVRKMSIIKSIWLLSFQMIMTFF